MEFFVKLCVFAIHVVLITCQLPDRTPIERYPYVMDMNAEGTFVLRWGFHNDSIIMFEVQANTLGYVGFGISENGLMWPADVVVGYVANNQVHFTDYHTTMHGHPVRDASQDWVIEYGYEENGWTVLGFYRALDTCDTVGDMKITTGTLRLLWAYHSQDPADGDSLMYHERKGEKAIGLFTTPSPPTSLPTDVRTYDFLNGNYTIPLNETTDFHCRVFDMSDVAQKHHIIKAEPVFSRGTEFWIDQMILYRCHVADPSILTSRRSFNCFTDAPNHVQFCREHVASFGHGRTPMTLPEDVGIPMGGVGEANVYVLATHYDMTERFGQEPLVDDSGIRVTYTAQLRPNDAAFLTMGNIISRNWLQFIPPGDPSFRQNAFCTERCLKWGFDGSGSNAPMTVVGVKFHTHELGRDMKLRHMSRVAGNQYRENPFLSHDDKYNPEDPTLRVLRNRQTISPDDHLKLECTYNSSDRFQPTLGGWSEFDELCRAYVLYYPRKQLEGCMSWSNYDKLRDGNGNVVNGRNVFNTLISTDWTNNDVMRRNLRTALDTSMENAQCWSSKATPSFAIDYFRQDIMNLPQPYVEPVTSTCGV